MSHPSRVRGVLHLAGALLMLAVAFQLIAGCSDDKKNPASPGGGTPQTTSFVGAFSNGTENGKISVTVNSTSLAGRLRAARAGAASVTGSGTLTFSGGGTQALTGTYNDVTDTLNLSGGGYSFVAEYDSSETPASLSGTYSGPNGTGFFGALDQSNFGGTIEIYIGTFQSDSTNVSGSFDVAHYDTLVGGLAFAEGTTLVIGLDGSVSGSGTIRTIMLSGQEGNFSLDATGTLDTSAHTVAGSWHAFDGDISKGDDGTWSGDLLP